MISISRDLGQLASTGADTPLRLNTDTNSPASREPTVQPGRTGNRGAPLSTKCPSLRGARQKNVTRGDVAFAPSSDWATRLFTVPQVKTHQVDLSFVTASSSLSELTAR